MKNNSLLYNKLRTTKFKIETWDAGWWQIRMALNEQKNKIFLPRFFFNPLTFNET